MTRSIQSRWGRVSPHSRWSHSRPRSHELAGRSAAAVAIRVTNCLRDRTDARFNAGVGSPRSSRWVWVSMKPGSTSRCRTSITSASPASTSIASLVPTATTRPSLTANASTQGRPGSPVQIRALTSARVTGAGGLSGPLHERPARLTPATQTIPSNRAIPVRPRAMWVVAKTGGSSCGLGARGCQFAAPAPVVYSNNSRTGAFSAKSDGTVSRSAPGRRVAVTSIWLPGGSDRGLSNQ